MSQIVGPPRLATGSHPQSKIYMCGMNVISWENGDRSITDTPECTPLPLAKIVHTVNDSYCVHTAEERDSSTGRHVMALCAECAPKVLALAHRTVGLPKATMKQGWAWVFLLLQDSLRQSPDGDRMVNEALGIAYARARGESMRPVTTGFWPIPFHAPPALALANEVLRSHSPTTVLREAGMLYTRMGDPAQSVPTEWYPIGKVKPGLTHFQPCNDGGVIHSSSTDYLLENGHRAIDMWLKAVPAPTPAAAHSEAVREPVKV